MSGRSKKVVLVLLAVALLAGLLPVQDSMNRDRDELGLTRVAPLENAPPMLAFTTVALGGFRGLISNALWIRASDLQDQDKFFEMMQLADWITKLEPHFAQVWANQAWNMGWNISVKFKDYPDRWRWVRAGIELLRDQGLKYNPNNLLLYHELAWFFQNKMGANTDDASLYYKQQWANDMAAVFGKKKPDLDELIHPQTQDQTNRAQLLQEKYKMDPVFMKQVDQEYGPLEWRLPEASAIYWAALGLEKAKLNPGKVNKDDLIGLRRVIYQSMNLNVLRGRLVDNPFEKVFEFGPNLDIIGKTSAAYEQAIAEDVKNRDNIQHAHRNFLRDAVYLLYEHNRIADAARWYQYLGTTYPDQNLLDDNTNSLPRQLTLDEYCVARVEEDVGGTSPDRVQSAIDGLLVNSYESLILNEDDRAAGYRLLAQKIWDTYESKIPKEREQAMGLKPVEETRQEVLSRLLDAEHGLPTEMRAALRAKLGMPPETAPAPAPAPAAKK